MLEIPTAKFTIPICNISISLKINLKDFLVFFEIFKRQDISHKAIKIPHSIEDIHPPIF